MYLARGAMHDDPAWTFAAPARGAPDKNGDSRLTKTPDYLERRNSAAEARKAMLERFRAAPGPDDPEFVKRQAERQAVNEARVVRAAERETARQAREAELAEQARRDAELAAEAERRAAQEAAQLAVEDAERQVALEAEQKAKRDARYAARKAAKKRRRRGL